jgi:catechol 2,3-dioxygenase-like lactoylglutathione lyase family enzyme
MRFATKHLSFVTACLLLCLPLTARESPKRPRITGIAKVEIYVTDLPAAREVYSKILNPTGCDWCEQLPGSYFRVNVFQSVLLSPALSPTPSNLIASITFATDNLPELLRFLVAQKIEVSKALKPKDNYLTVLDPEGHRIAFMQGFDAKTESVAKSAHIQVPMRLIHAGFVVNDRAAEDKFYKDILGFHVYWHGGMKDGEDNWVDMQVPDGTDWIEYMLGVGPNASHKTLGVMNHIAIGLENLQEVTEHLRDERIVPILEEPKIGRDGKWQLNLYDPDETRVELMEFKPTNEPCCSPYTGPHPGPKQ